MKKLYIHTDTTGMWNWKKDATDPTQPHLLRLSMIFDPGEPFPVNESVDFIDPPDEWVFEEGAIKQNGITRAYAQSNGATLASVAKAISDWAEDAEAIVAYNSDWHRKVIERTVAEAGIEWMIPKDRWSCVMRAATPICRIPSTPPRSGFRFPKLGVALEHLTGSPLILSPDPRAAGSELIVAVRDMDRAIERLNQEGAAS